MKYNGAPIASVPAMTAFDGVAAVPATPFTQDGNLDLASLRRYARYALAHGATAFVAPAVAGEVDTLTDDERYAIVETLLEEAAGKLPVIGGATAADLAGSLRHTRRYSDMGCAGVLAYVPYRDPSSYRESIRALAGLAPGFLMVQDLDLGAAALPVPLIAELHRGLPTFTWIKVETSGRGRKLSAIRDATGGTLRLGTAGPDIIEHLDRGIHAYLSTFSIGVYVEIWRLHQSGRRDAAMRLYRRFLPCLAFMATHPNVQWRFTKAILQGAGIFETVRVRIRAPELDMVEARLVEELVRLAGELANVHD